MLKMDKSSHQHVFSVKHTVLVSIWIFKDLNRAREKGIQGERRCRANTVVIQSIGVIREGWALSDKSEFTDWRDAIGSNKISGLKRCLTFSLPP